MSLYLCFLHSRFFVYALYKQPVATGSDPNTQVVEQEEDMEVGPQKALEWELKIKIVEQETKVEGPPLRTRKHDWERDKGGHYQVGWARRET